MIDYCIEFGPEDNYSATIHKLSCASIDHGTLLGMGRLAGLGNFASASAALGAGKHSHPDATRCLDCCILDLLPGSRVSNHDVYNNFVTM